MLPLLASLTLSPKATALDLALERMPSVLGSLLNLETAALPMIAVMNKNVAVIVVRRRVGKSMRTASPAQKAVNANATVIAISVQTSKDDANIVRMNARNSMIGGPERITWDARNACSGQSLYNNSMEMTEYLLQTWDGEQPSLEEPVTAPPSARGVCSYRE